jgi:O-antigen ligase/tetratricopeptide (TPR) repeat protein
MVSLFNRSSLLAMPAHSTILDPDLLPVEGAAWDRAFTCLLAAMFAFMPASFGAVEAWSQLIVIAAAAALSLCLVARVAFDREFRFTWSWLYVPAALFILLIGAQLMPLSLGALKLIAPWNVSIRQQLLGANFPAGAWTTLSLYPTATRDSLYLAMVCVAVFIVVASTYRSLNSVKTLLTVIFAIGCAEATLALAQIVSSSTSIYWSIPVSGQVVTSGTFVNYSNFAQFMNLSLGSGLALLLIRMREQSQYAAPSLGLKMTLQQCWEMHRWYLAGVILCALAVCASMSRNGVISLIVAAAITGIALYRRGTLGWQGWIVGALPLALFAVVLVFGFDLVYGRLATLHDADSFKSRQQLTAATLRAWRNSPLLGTGAGTHEVVFPMYDESVSPVLAAQADNDYAQLLEETGITGAALVGAFAIGIGWLAIRLATRGQTPLSIGVFGLMFGLVAISIHSATDFGQRLPANGCLTATFCGLVVAMSRIEKRHQGKDERAASNSIPAPLSVRRILSLGAAAVLVLVWGIAIRHAYTSYIAERWYAGALEIEGRLHADTTTSTDETYADLISTSQAAVDAAPYNVNYRYWLNNYRWESLSRNVDPASGRTILRADAIPFVRQIADDLTATRILCPTFGPAYALEGQLRLFVLADTAGAELIRAGAKLAPYDPPTCLVAGELAARNGNFEQATPLLRRAIAIHPEYFPEIATFYIGELRRPALARELAGSDYRRLTELIRVLPNGPDSATLSQDLTAAAETSLRSRVDGADAKPEEIATLAQIEMQRGDLASAIDLFDRALSREYTQIDWRVKMAHALAASGRVDDAIHQTRICLRLRPNHAEAIQLLSDLSGLAEDERIKNAH